jgi:hypothetical protein
MTVTCGSEMARKKDRGHTLYLGVSNFQRAMSMVIPRSRSALSLSRTHAYLKAVGQRWREDRRYRESKRDIERHKGRRGERLAKTTICGELKIFAAASGGRHWNDRTILTRLSELSGLLLELRVSCSTGQREAV